VRYYKGAFKPTELLKEPSCWITWANTAEAAEALGDDIAQKLRDQKKELEQDN
jgi:hypothetical protein